MRSYIAANHCFVATERDFHQEEAYWWCSLVPGSAVANGPLADPGQVAVAWKTLDELRASGEFAPWPLLDWLQMSPDQRPLYLGDCL